MIKKFIKKTERVIEIIEGTRLNIKTIFFSILAIVAIRFFFESVFLDFTTTNYEELLASSTTALFLFFLFSYVLMVIFIHLITKEKIPKVASVVLWGQWIVILPPIIDHIVFEGHTVWSFYIFDSVAGVILRFFTFFGDNPAFGITFGTRTEILIITILFGLYIYIKKEKKIQWLFLGSLAAYLFSFILGIVPNIITYFYEVFSGTNLFTIDKTHIIGIFLTSLQYFGIERGTFKTVLSFKMAFYFNIFLFVELIFLQFLANKKIFYALLKNVRYPQMFFNSGLMFVGISLGVFYFPHNFSLDMFSILAVINLWIAVFCGWFYSVFVNDLADVKTDEITNTSRPLIKGELVKREYIDYSFLFLILSLMSAIVVSDKIFLLMALFLMLTWVYSKEPFRLKRFVFVSSVLSSFASLLFLVMGYILLSDGQSLLAFPWKIIIYLFTVYALLIPVKDLKDIDGDGHTGTTTLPMLIGEKNARMVLGTLLFLSYFFSVIVLNEMKLLVPAVMFGAISYYIMTSNKYKARVLPWWVLGIVFIYGILLVLITFG